MISNLNWLARLSILVLILLSTTACSRDNTYITMPTAPSATPVAPTPISTKIEFRVSGSASSARIRFSSPSDGLVQTTSSLPFFTSFSTTANSQFLSLEVTPVSFPAAGLPFLSAQIYVDGILFREATSVDFFTPLTVSGNWRR